MDTIQFNPQRLTLDARQLDDLIVLWLRDRHRRTAAVTAEGYAVKIKYFREWWSESGPLYDWELNEEGLLDFNLHLDEHISFYGKPLAYNTRKDALRRLGQMFRWAQRGGYLVHDFSQLVPGPSGSAPLRTAAPLDCLRRLMEATAKSPYPTRDRAIIAVLLGCGLRRSEASAVSIETIQIDADGSGKLSVAAKVVNGREVQARMVAFDRSTGRYIRAHLDRCLGTSGPLFPSRNRPRLTPIGVYKAVKKVIDLAGLDDQIQGCHDLRRCFTTYYSRNRRGEGYGHLLSKQLGHSNYRMTSSYSLQDVEDVKESMISPFALLDAEDLAAGERGA